MAPSDPFIAAQAVVDFMLDNFDHENACFLAERVHAEVCTEESLRLLASCFYRNGEFFKAYHLLKNNDQHRNPSLKFLLAQCCYQMQKYTEAESILTCNSVFRRETVPADEIIKEFGASAPFALAMVGDICRISCRYSSASDFYRKSLSLNPFLWSSYQHLCDIGEAAGSGDASDKLLCKPSSLHYCLRQPENNPPTVAAKSRQSVAFENIGAPRDVSTPWLPNPHFAQNSPSKSQFPTGDFTKREQNLNSISAISMNITGHVGDPNDSTQMFLNVPGGNHENSTGGEEMMDVLSDDTEDDEGSRRDGSLSQIGEGSHSGEPARRLTRRQSKLMAAQGSSNETSPVISETPAGGQTGFYETPDEQIGQDGAAPRAPTKIKQSYKSSKRAVPHQAALLTLSNFNQGGSSIQSQSAVPLAPANSNTNNQPQSTSHRTPSSSHNSTPDAKAAGQTEVHCAKPVTTVVNATRSTATMSSSSGGGLVPSQQTNNGNSSNVSVTPLQSAPGNGGGLRRSSRLYMGSNQLKENSKVLSKASISRRQRMERAPNKSNSITNVLNAEGEKMFAKLNDKSLKCISPSTIKTEPNIPEASPVHVSTQTAIADPCSLTEVQAVPPFKQIAMPVISEGNQTRVTIDSEDLEPLLQTLRVLGKSYYNLSKFQSDQAIKVLHTLPLDQFETGFVLECIGRAHFEKSEFRQAVEVFKRLWDLEPYRVKGLDIYSTSLWQLKQSEQLSYLAQEAVTLCKDRPQVWCVVGNCFALQKEHEHAIQFFSRAIQVDPNHAYAYTLLGLEYLEVGLKPKAENCFRNAVRIHERHYPAWCGLGQLFFQQEKYMEAEVHYAKALAIKRNSPLLLCYLAVVQHKQNKSQLALERLNEALTIDPKHPLCKYHKAMILSSLNECHEALKVLKELELQIPNESLLYFSIGQVYKKLGEPHLELMNFAWAMDLDPKGSSSLIKQAIEKNFLPRDKEMQNTIARSGTMGDGLFSELDSTFDDLF